MRVSYYPGCTLNDRAANLNLSTKAAADLLGIELLELPSWTCCGATHPLTQDKIANFIPQMRILSNVRSEGLENLTTTCAFCYNTLKRANYTIAGDPLTQKRLNAFLREDKRIPPYEKKEKEYDYQDYEGEVSVLHFLEILRDWIGFEEITKRTTKNLEGLKIAPYYGCQLLRPPEETGMDDPENPSILEDLLASIGGQPVSFPFKTECCGSYLSLSSPEVAARASHDIIGSAQNRGAEVIVLSCPLCYYNIDDRQAEITCRYNDVTPLPVLFFTQLLALALGAREENLGLNQHAVDPRPLLKEKGLIPQPENDQ